MKTRITLFTSALAYLVISVSCSDTKKEDSESDKSVLLESLSAFSAIDMPFQLANGDAFPTDSNIINGWLATASVIDGVETDQNVISHTWGLWQALTEETSQEFDGRMLRRFETWYTPQDVMRAGEEGVQLKDLKRTDGLLQFRKKFKLGHDQNLNPVAGDISGKVKYSPSMAQRALNGKFFDTTKLKSMIVEGEINSVNFMSNDVMLKPVYRVLTDMNKVEGKTDTYYFSIWGGKKDGGKSLDNFSKVIHVTTNNTDPKIDNKTLYGIKSFINHDMTAAEAYTYNHSSKEGQQFTDTAHVGDPIILLGMHCSTRETRRWT